MTVTTTGATTSTKTIATCLYFKIISGRGKCSYKLYVFKVTLPHISQKVV